MLEQQTLFKLNHAIQIDRFDHSIGRIKPFKRQLLKWIGNKQRFAHEIISYFPESIESYFEPFLGSGGVLGVLAPKKGMASDCFQPLIEIWNTLKISPNTLKKWYNERWNHVQNLGKETAYELIKSQYNQHANPADLLFLSRSCYGGVVRFRKLDGYMSTPCGIHSPIHPDSFSQRVDEWHQRISGTDFYCADYSEMMARAKPGDLIYCDPPYSFSQSILYGAQEFSLQQLFHEIESCKRKGVFVVLSIDGTKKTGNLLCDIPIPDGLFDREIMIHCGRSMLRRFQKEGKTLEDEEVKDRLLLTY